MIKKFKAAGATRSSSAVLPSELGISRNLIFKRLMRQGIILEAQRGYYYLSESRERDLNKKRVDLIWTVLMVFAIIALLLFFWSTI